MSPTKLLLLELREVKMLDPLLPARDEDGMHQSMQMSRVQRLTASRGING